MSDEKDWEEMCRRLVRWDENRLRSEGNNAEDLILEMRIRENGSWGRWTTVEIVSGNKVLHFYSGEEKKRALLRMVWSYAFQYKFLDLDMWSYPEDLEKPGTYEELDLRLSSYGF